VHARQSIAIGQLCYKRDDQQHKKPADLTVGENVDRVGCVDVDGQALFIEQEGKLLEEQLGAHQ
jgi:hypothetical protein